MFVITAAARLALSAQRTAAHAQLQAQRATHTHTHTRACMHACKQRLSGTRDSITRISRHFLMCWVVSSQSLARRMQLARMHAHATQHTHAWRTHAHGLAGLAVWGL